MSDLPTHNASRSDNGRGPSVPADDLLLAWVEGEALHPAAELTVARYLSDHPEEARRLELMRLDRTGLRRLPSVSPSVDLVARVASRIEPMLERRVLLDEPPMVETTAAARNRLRLVRPREWSIRRSLLQEHRGRLTLATAAVLALTGLGTYFIAASMFGPGKGSPVTFTPPRPNPVQTTSAPGATALASAKSAPEAPGPAIPITVATADAPWSLEGLVERERVAREQGIITPSAAVELAMQGQLVLRVRTQAEEAAGTSLTPEGPPSPDQEWFIAHEAPESTALLLSRDVVMGPPPPELDWSVSPRGTIFLAQTRLDMRTIEQLQSTLAAKGEVVFEQAPVAIDSASPAASRPGWGAVPIIVERRQ